MRINKHQAILIVILLFAAFFRVLTIGSESYWLDESISVKQAEQNYSTAMNMIKKDIHMPLYTTLLYGWIKAFGISETSGRSLSAIFGILSVWISYLLARKLFSKQIALWTAAIIAFSPILIYYSQEARVYSLFVLLTMVSYYYFVDYVKKSGEEKKEDNNYKSLILYIIFTVCLMYTYVFSFLVILSQNIYFLYDKLKKNNHKKEQLREKFFNKKLLEWVSSQAMLLVFFIPWITILISQVRETLTMWISKPNFGWVAKTFIDFFGNPFSFAVVIISIILFFYNKHHKKLYQEHKDKIIFLSLWILVPFILVITYSLTVSPLYHTRYMLFTLPAIIMLFCLMLEKITEKKKYLGQIIIGAILIFSLVSIIMQATTIEKDDWRGVSTFVKENLQSDETVFVDPMYHQDPFSYYYAPECFRYSNVDDIYTCNFNKYKVVSINWKAGCCDANTKLTAINGQDELEDYLDKKILLISIKPELLYNNNSLFDYFSSRKNYTLIKEYGDVKIYRFE